MKCRIRYLVVLQARDGNMLTPTQVENLFPVLFQRGGEEPVFTGILLSRFNNFFFFIVSIVKNMFGFSILLFTAFNCDDKSYRQVLTPSTILSSF